MRLATSLGLLAVSAALAFAIPASARNIDCSKPGNANKAACKNGPTAAKPAKAAKAEKPAKTPKAPKPAATTKPAAATKPARVYDCSKPGNANKAACKGTVTAAPPTKPARTYDCSKPGNANKAACKGTAAAVPQANPIGARSKPATAPSRTGTPPAQSSAPATAQPNLPPASGSRIVPWTTKSGKVYHYDCSKPGNFNKQACKQK